MPVLGAGLLLPLFLASASAAHQQGVDLYKQHKYAEAIAALKQSIPNEPPDSADYRESVVMLGQSYFMLSRPAEAIPWLEKAPLLNEANYMLGYAYFQAGEPAKSVIAFARLFGVQHESAAAHLLAGQMLLKKELRDGAEMEIRKAIALDPKLPQTHFILAEISMARGNPAGSIADLEAELKVNPNFSMAWYRLGDAYARLSRCREAIPHLQRAIWLNSDFSGPFILLGKCYFEDHNYTNAEGILRQALVLDPRNREANYLLGRTLAATGRPEEAKPFLEKLK